MSGSGGLKALWSICRSPKATSMTPQGQRAGRILAGVIQHAASAARCGRSRICCRSARWPARCVGDDLTWRSRGREHGSRLQLTRQSTGLWRRRRLFDLHCCSEWRRSSVAAPDRDQQSFVWQRLHCSAQDRPLMPGWANDDGNVRLARSGCTRPLNVLSHGLTSRGNKVEAARRSESADYVHLLKGI
jgi:hypothetical protein